MFRERAVAARYGTFIVNLKKWSLLHCPSDVETGSGHCHQSFSPSFIPQPVNLAEGPAPTPQQGHCSLSLSLPIWGGEQAWERLWLTWHMRDQREEIGKRNKKGDKERRKRESWSELRERCRSHQEIVNFKESPTSNDKVARSSYCSVLFFKSLP